MKYIITDLVDDFRNFELGENGINILWTLVLVLAGIYWLGLSDYGAFFQVTGCIAYIAAGCKWISCTTWAKKFKESIFNDEE
jgi:hypothetical protein